MWLDSTFSCGLVPRLVPIWHLRGPPCCWGVWVTVSRFQAKGNGVIKRPCKTDWGPMQIHTHPWLFCGSKTHGKWSPDDATETKRGPVRTDPRKVVNIIPSDPKPVIQCSCGTGNPQTLEALALWAHYLWSHRRYPQSPGPRSGFQKKPRALEGNPRRPVQPADLWQARPVLVCLFLFLDISDIGPHSPMKKTWSTSA